jgi:hypothetical protein
MAVQACNSKKVAWFIIATYYEACSCNAPCPCPFGLPMTNSYCKLNSLVDIHESKYKNCDLSGLKVILSGAVGGAGEYFISEPVSAEQISAFKEMIEIINPGGFKKITFGGKVSIEYDSKNETIKYGTSNIKVELKKVIGKNNLPVIVKNLDGKIFENYIPHLALINCRALENSTSNFHFENKAGFTSEWNISTSDFQNN